MTKRIGSLLLALIMTISLAVPAMAVTETAQTEEPTASTVESTASTDADTSAPTPDETPDTSETEKDTDSREKKTAAKKAVAKAAVSVQSVQSNLDAYFADLPLKADTQDGASNLQWSVKDGILTSPKGFMQSTRSLILTATADTHLTFQYKVSTEPKYDTFTLTHGSTTVVNGVSGIIDWTLVELDVKAGEHPDLLLQEGQQRRQERRLRFPPQLHRWRRHPHHLPRQRRHW